MDRPLSYLVVAGVAIAGIAASAVAAHSASGSVSITKSRSRICMTSNGLPDHATGRFPNVGKLDQCNGGTLNGKFVYFVTDSYPCFPHCAWGKVSRDFGRP